METHWQRTLNAAIESETTLPLSEWIEAYFAGDPLLKAKVRAKLTEVLQTEQAAEYAGLSREHKQKLFQDFAQFNPALTLALIETIRHYGGAAEVEFIQTLSHSAPFYGVLPAAQAAAAQALPEVLARAEREKVGAQMLRASSAPVGKETLLRPVLETPTEEETQLLRASGRTEE